MTVGISMWMWVCLTVLIPALPTSFIDQGWVSFNLSSRCACGGVVLAVAHVLIWDVEATLWPSS